MVVSTQGTEATRPATTPTIVTPIPILSLYDLVKGKPYIWGSAAGRTNLTKNVAGFDCSGFIAWTFYNASGGKIKLPAFTDAIANSPDVKQVSTPQNGDIVLYKFHDPNQPGVTYPHTAIYIGNGKVVQSGGVASNVNTASVDQLPGATFFRTIIPVSTSGNTTPSINPVSTVGGFDSGHLNDILLNTKKAVEANVDPFLWLGIVSKESNFNSGAKNPTSGACGYAQIYPCLNLTPEKNIEEGLNRLKAFLTRCGGDQNCALNLYSGGAGQSYITDVLGRASAIKSGNPTLATADPNFDPTLPDTNVSAGDCSPIMIELPAGLKIPFPDVGCIILQSLNNLQDQLAEWFKTWQLQHVPNFIFVTLGLLFLGIGINGIVQQTTGINPATTAIKAAV